MLEIWKEKWKTFRLRVVLSMKFRRASVLYELIGGSSSLMVCEALPDGNTRGFNNLQVKACDRTANYSQLFPYCKRCDVGER